MSNVVKRKAGCTEVLAEHFISRLDGRLHGAALYGSLAKSAVDSDSDVDTLV